MSVRLQRSCLDDAHGAAEERTEPYLNTVKGVPEAATQRIAKKPSGAEGLAGGQARLTGELK